MSALSNIEIIDVPPERVYVFPKKLTKSEIQDNVNKLHTIANEDADRTIYCLFDDVVMQTSTVFEVCFPVSHLDLKKYNVSDFKVIQREKVVSGVTNGDFSKLTEIISELTEYAKEQGFSIKPPYRYLFTLHKKPFFSTKPPEFSMHIHIPVIKN